jgi:undecaprenyl-diphosphatase
MTIDEHVFRWINGLSGRFGPLDWAASHLANDYFLPAAIGLIAFGLWFTGHNPEARRRNQWAFIYGAVGVGFSALAVMIINHYYFRDRPYVLFPQITPEVKHLFYLPTVSSFPSYSAALTFAFAFGVWLRNKKVGIVLFGLSVVMALARIYVGVHYPLDILGGAAVGIAVTYLFFWLLKLIQPIVDLLLAILERLSLA